MLMSFLSYFRLKTKLIKYQYCTARRKTPRTDRIDPGLFTIISLHADDASLCVGPRCCDLYFRHKPTELAHSFSFCSCVSFCLYGPFKCISLHKFSRQTLRFLTLFFRSYFCLIFLSAIYLFLKVSLSLDITLCG